MSVFLKTIFIVLLAFIPFAFAGAEPWAFSILQAGVFLLWILAWAVHKGPVYITQLSLTALLTLGFMLLLALWQSCFPHTLLQADLHGPGTLISLYTLHTASLLATYGMILWLVRFLFPTKHDMIPLLRTIVIINAVVALASWSLPNGEYIFYWAGLRGGIGPFLNRNHAAVFFAFGALLCLGLFFESLTAGKTVSGGYKKYLAPRPVVWAMLCAVLTYAVIMTRSRGGMLSLLAGFFLYAFLHFATLSKKPQRLRGVVATLLLLCLTVWLIGTHWEQLNYFAQRTDGTSSQIRVMLYQAGMRLLADYPYWGIGIGALPVAITAYTAYPLPQYIEHLHNDWLELLLGTGVIGLIPVLVGICIFLALAIRRLKKLPSSKRALFTALLSALGMMSAASLVDFHFFIPANALLFFVCVGLLCSISFDKHHVRRIAVSGVAKVLLIVCVLPALYLPTQCTLSWRSTLFGQGVQPAEKLRQYQQALAYYPSPRNAVRLGNAYWNAAVAAPSEQERAQYRQQAAQLAAEYLRKYPKEPELSLLYVRTQQL